MTQARVRDLAVGDEVMKVEGSWTSRVSGPFTVEKIGKRDVVLSDGTRYSLLNDRQHGTSYGATLYRPDAPEIAAMRKDDAIRDARRDVLKAAAAFEGHNSYTAEDIAALRTALDVAEGLLR